MSLEGIPTVAMAPANAADTIDQSSDFATLQSFSFIDICVSQPKHLVYFHGGKSSYDDIAADR